MRHRRGYRLTTAIVVLSSATLLVVILLVEGSRPRVRGGVDFLRAATAVYFLCYGLAPVYLQFENPAVFRSSTWAWILRTPFHAGAFAEASVLALIGYLAMVAVYWVVAPGPAQPTVPADREDLAYLWAVGTGLGLAGMIAMLVYASSIGGWTVFFVQALAFRGTEPPVVTPLAFLKNVAPLVIGAMLVFNALREYHGRGVLRTLARALLVFFFGASLAILFHQAGRAAFAAFLLTLPLIRAVQLDRLRVRHLLLGMAVLAGLAVFGKGFFVLAKNPGAALNPQSLVAGVPELARGLVREFTFPIATLANAIVSVPERIPWRWFYDIPLAFVYLVPQRLTGLAHEATITMLNTTMLRADGGVPVDLLSFGYFSLFLPGVLLTAGGMGAILGVGERLFPPSRDPLVAGLRVSWLLLIAFRVMYADPQLFWQPGLYLTITTVAAWVPRFLRHVGGTSQPARQAGGRSTGQSRGLNVYGA